ncbi:UNVERIFIED_CONTAM: hypothetical protein FKN15_041498 [Acipenser sinensis]
MFAVLLLLCSIEYLIASDHTDARPNFIVMMVDDLGIGDIGCYGNSTVRTPNIDRLAQEGVKLTQHIAAGPVCTPSRAAFMTGRYPIRSVLLLLCSIEYLRASDHTDARPNFIVMMVDDLGIGDIGCYGNSTVRTPNIDRLAQEGVKLTQHIAAGPVCTPSRAAFMTGRYPIRSGKWHLGVNCDSRNDNCHHPVNHGFDYFYGLPFTLFNDCKPGEGTDILADLQTLFRQASQVLGLALLTLLIARLTGFFLVSWKLIVLLTITVLVGFCSWYVPFALVQTWNCIIMKNQDVIEQPMTLETLPQRLLNEAEYFIERITNVVERLGLSNKTMMYFTSDHGGHLEDSDSRGQKGGWNGIYKGYAYEAYKVTT